MGNAVNRSRHEVARFVGSLLALVAVVVLVPMGLAAVSNRRFGSVNPLAGAVPPWQWFGDDPAAAATDPIADSTILDALIRLSLCAAWVAVVVIAVTTVAEAVHLTRHGGIPRPDIRGLGWAQRVGRLIAAGLIIVLPMAPSAASIASSVRSPTIAGPMATPALLDRAPAQADDARPPPAQAPPDAPTAPTSATHVVRQGESVYGIAERLAMASGASTIDVANAILDANLGREMGPGERFTNPAYVQVGWQLLIPAPYAGAAVPAPNAAPGSARPDSAQPASAQPDSAPTAIVVGGTSPTSGATYVVQRNDTLWDIAATQLGDPTAWTRLWELNAGREMDDGRTLDDPGLILPGWELVLAPPDADAASEQPSAPVDDPAPVDVEPDPPEAAPPIVPEAPVGSAADGASDDDVQAPVGDYWDVDDLDPVVDDVPLPEDLRDWPITVGPLDAPPSSAPSEPPPIRFDDMVAPAITTSPATAPPATTPPGHRARRRTASPGTAPSVPTSSAVPVGGATSGGTDHAPPSDAAPDAPSPIRLEHAALLAAGVLALVGVRRRQRLRAARPRHRVPDPHPDVMVTERRLRAIDAGERTLRVDVATRAIATALRDTNAQIGWLIVSLDGDIDVRLTGPSLLPPPWSGSSQDWRLGADVPIELLADAARQADMPCLALVQVGVSPDGGEVLLDVEACGTLAIEATPRQGDEVVAAVAAGLASSLYAEVAHLIAVSLDAGALLGHRNAHTVEAADAALDLAASLVGTTIGNPMTTFSLRSLRTGGEAWEPAIVLLQHDDVVGVDDADRICPAAAHGLGVVVCCDPGTLDAAGARIVAEVDGWRLSGFGADVELTPIGLPAADVRAIQAVLCDAERPLESIELAAAADVRWSDDTGAAIDIAPDIDNIDEVIDVDLHPGGDEHADVARPLDDGRVGNNADNGGEETGDGEDDDVVVVVVPFEPCPYEVVVGLLGGIAITDRAGNPGAFDRSKTIELIAWLATHRDRSTRSGARTALWEMDVRDATFANVVSEARRALARLVAPPVGEEWVGRTLTDQLPIHDLVVTDADLVQARVDHARLQPPAAAMDTLHPAVAMIRDMPFAGTSYLWPDAEGLTSNLVLLAMTATTEFAGHALSLGDTDGVFWATGQGMKVLPGHEELIALRMRAHARAGDLAGVRQEWESYERVLNADSWSDGEPAPKLVALRHELLSS